jgi:chlorobactene glucosyltransferase
MELATLLAGAAWAGLIGWLLRRAMRQFHAHRAASLPPGDAAAETLPDVAIVVPARNEIANIAACLVGLAAQRGLSAGSSITVVDDGSQDGTGRAVARLARSDPRIGLIEPGPLPAGWMGKPHACWRGAEAAEAEWLCFVDADVRAAPDLLAAAIGAAQRQRLDMLSLTPFQDLGSFWERLIIPPGLVLIACVQDRRPVDDPASPEIAANGQIILIRGAVYRAIGGHAAVRGEICEDKALAARVKRGGWRFRMLGAEQLARTRMYTGFASLWEGLAKNATEIIGDVGVTVMAATAAWLIGWTAILLPVAAALIAVRHPSAAAASGAALAWLGSLATIGVQVGTARHCRIPLVFGLLFPFAYPVIAALAWRSAALRRTGRVTWKGRTYALQRKTSPSRP